MNTLDQIHQQEKSLTAEQWEAYIDSFATPVERKKRVFQWDRISAILHATAEEKSERLERILAR